MKLTNPLLSIACGQFSLSIMQVLFMFYYVKIYMNVFHVPQLWFNIAQVLFMIWNAINDPLFGYLQDSPHSWMKNRASVIKYFSPFLAVSFIFMWIPWNTTGSYLEGIHLILSLLLYDAFFSCISVAWSALFADSTKEPRLRVAAMKYSQISILISVNIIAVTEKLSHSLETFNIFLLIVVGVSAIGFLCLQVAGSLEQPLPFSRVEDESENLLESNHADKSLKSSDSLAHAWTLTKEIVKNKSFLLIMIANFLHTGRSVAHMNFASTATEILISQSVLPKGSLRLSVFYAVLTLGPQILLILNERTILKYGAANVLKASYILSVISSGFFLFGTNSYVIMIFMLVDSITVHSAAPLFNIVISDFVDDDAKRNNRRSTLSSLIFSLNALFVKPAQSLAPVAIVYFLNGFGYDDYTSKKVISSSLSTGMLFVLFGTPLILGGIQMLFFRAFSLTHIHHKKSDITEL
ncbi:unnamed protein product [Auanema sp. JU1783]|nr:unnamed protein product [Auanema sp. JU1783]